MQAKGTLGLIATNTVAQGDTREVGLDAMTAAGFTITRAIQSRSWPASSANLEYAAVWGTSAAVADEVPRIADDIQVRRISTLLEASGGMEGTPLPLDENAGTAFIGCYVLGMGFVVEPEEAQEWIAADPRNAEVLFPYLNGEDLNGRPDTSASRWVVDFNNLPEAQAEEYTLPYRHILNSVKEERMSKPKAVSSAPWWLFLRARPSMRKAVSGLPEVLVIARVSKTVMPLRVATGHVFHEKLVVFATRSYNDQAVLSSSAHQFWAIKYGTTMRTDPTYTPDLVFGSFPRPSRSDRLEVAGKALEENRREVMLRRGLGLTHLYNMVNDSSCGDDADVCLLRELHIEIDRATMEAYGWSDIALNHGWHSYRQNVRWSPCPAARTEIVDRLLVENHQRFRLECGGQGASPGDTGADQEGTLFD